MMKNKIIENLIKLYKTQGFITEDEIFEQTSDAKLSIFDINFITEHLLMHGVVICEKKEKIATKKGRGYRRDYTKFFKNLTKEYKGLKFFIKYYNSIDSLAEGEWITLLQQTRHGNDWAKKRLFDVSMKKAIKQVHVISKKLSLNFEDMLQIASFGILNAIASFDETEHSSFPSYVPLAINSQLRRDAYLYSNPVIDIPAHVMDNLLKIHTLVQNHNCNICSLYKNIFSCPNLQKDIINKLECTPNTADEYLKYLQPIEDIQEDTITTEIDLSNTKKEEDIRKYVASLLVNLKPKEEIIIRMRFGIGSNREHTLEEIGQRYNLTRERIRQIEQKALKKLAWHVYREHIAKDLIKE